MIILLLTPDDKTKSHCDENTSRQQREQRDEVAEAWSSLPYILLEESPIEGWGGVGWGGVGSGGSPHESREPIPSKGAGGHRNQSNSEFNGLSKAGDHPQSCSEFDAESKSGDSLRGEGESATPKPEV